MPFVKYVLMATVFVLATGHSMASEKKSIPGTSQDFLFQTGKFLRSAAYGKPNDLSSEASASGAYDVNRLWDSTHQGPWYIEEQRYGFDAFAAGLSYHRQDLIDRARKIFDWGFGRQSADGGFDCPDSFHSTSFFVEAVAHAGLLMPSSEALKSSNQAWVDSIKGKVHRAAEWMIDPKNEVPGKAHNRPYTHRFYLVGLALGEAGLLSADPKLIEHSRQYIREGILKQDPSGFNPENGGYDVSYHAFGMFLAITYYTVVADENLRTQMKPMIAKGIAWLAGRAKSDGTFDLSGATRVGGKETENMRNGKPKTMSYWSAYRALYYWGYLTHDKALLTLAAKVAEAARH